jgi:hypothetical protein
MDFETLVTILLIVFYFVAQVASSKKRRQQPQRVPEKKPVPTIATERPKRKVEPELEDALREIRTALGLPDTTPAKSEQPRPQPKPAKLPAPPKAPAPVSVKTPPARLPTPRSVPVHPVPASDFEHARIPVEFVRPEGIENFPARRLKEERKPLASAPEKPIEAPQADVLGMLRKPQSLRDAIILSEVLGPPKSRRT